LEQRRERVVIPEGVAPLLDTHLTARWGSDPRAGQ
jgi:hypothetical protein